MRGLVLFIALTIALFVLVLISTGGPVVEIIRDEGKTTNTTPHPVVAPTSVPTMVAPPRVQAVARTAPSKQNVWDALARCESSGRWNIANSLHQGGLQFAVSTWDRYAPPGYPRDAQLATREQQIAVARLVLGHEGPHAWPTCGPRVGLRRGA